ncbi:MAG: hypothetical protein MUD12_05335 [Spirochaetes bacterium]|jgi:hypothetical protein|nr:hypothetical protein [Spirochaetota bacterium]
MDEIDQILSDIENPDLDNISETDEIDVEDLLGDEAGTAIGNLEKSDEKKPLKIESAPADDYKLNRKPEQIKISDKDQFHFTVKGTKSWNTKEPYIIDLDFTLFENEKKDLNASFYFTEKTITAEMINLNVKKMLINFIRKPSLNVSNEYDAFIYKIIIDEIENIKKYFNIEESKKQLFIYHLGPLSLFKIIMVRFETQKFGFCYKYSKGNMAVKFYPHEFIKMKILIWFEQNINALDISFDSIQAYEEFKDIIEKRYSIELKNFNARYNDIISRMPPEKTISREKLLKIKGADWFGLSNMVVYKRFIERTIFG